MEALHVNYYEHQQGADEVLTGINNAAFLIRELAAVPLSELSSSPDNLALVQRQELERRLRTLTRKTRFSHGPQLDEEELANLPPVMPTGPETVEG